MNARRLACRIVEAEAYYGPEDPASRARRGGDLRKAMYGDVGAALIYGVHGRWLLNIVAHEEGGAGAVLIRSGEPVDGLDLMRKLRGVKDPRSLTTGPGRLTEAMAIDKSLHGKPVYTGDHGLWIELGEDVPSSLVARSRRVGVSKDLPTPLRFYIKGSLYVSRR